MYVYAYLWEGCGPISRLPQLLRGRVFPAEVQTLLCNRCKGPALCPQCDSDDLAALKGKKGKKDNRDRGKYTDNASSIGASMSRVGSMRSPHARHGPVTQRSDMSK